MSQINKKILDARRALRKGETLWWCSGYLEVHLEAYRTLASDYAETLRLKKSQYYCSLVEDCGGDQRKLHRLVDSWRGRERTRVLPEAKSAADLANRFTAFFANQVMRHRSNFYVSAQESFWLSHPCRYINRQPFFVQWCFPALV